MPLPDEEEESARTIVIELEPDHIYVMIGDPKPDSDRIELLLRRTIDQWFGTHPHCVMDRTQPVAEHGVLHGIHIWYHVDDRESEPIEPELRQTRPPLTVAIWESIRQRVPAEHLEALIIEAVKTARLRRDWEGTQVVVNPQGIAVILEKGIDNAAVMPVDSVYPALEHATISKLQAWLKAPSGRRHVILINGSWFRPQTNQARKSEIVDPPFVKTNMTYDRGRRPGE